MHQNHYENQLGIHEVIRDVSIPILCRSKLHKFMQMQVSGLVHIKHQNKEQFGLCEFISGIDAEQS